MITDGLNNELKIGQRVIYNQSGNLTIGTITNMVIRYKEYYGRSTFTGVIYIKNEHKDHISKVRNPTSIVALEYL